VTHDADIKAQRARLSDITDMAGVMAKACFEIFQSAPDAETRLKAVTAFDICGRNVRLSILAETKLFAALSTAVFSAANESRPSRVRTDADRFYDQMRDRERDREHERDRDGFLLTPMGRAEALEKVLVRNPDLDPDGRYTAQVIDIKARLRGETPPPEPDPPPAVRHPPANRAERRRLERRLRRASG
jgi:hypothetical protein